MTCGKCCDLVAPAHEERIGTYHQCAGVSFNESREGRINVPFAAGNQGNPAKPAMAWIDRGVLASWSALCLGFLWWALFYLPSRLPL